MRGLRRWSDFFVHLDEGGELCGPVLPAESHRDAAGLPGHSLACWSCAARLVAPLVVDDATCDAAAALAIDLKHVREAEAEGAKSALPAAFRHDRDAGRVALVMRRKRERAERRARGPVEVSARPQRLVVRERREIRGGRLV